MMQGAPHLRIGAGLMPYMRREPVACPGMELSYANTLRLVPVYE
jgi:hypothetical protein